MMLAKIVLATAIEIAYAVFTRAWLPDKLQGAELEVAISAVRLATVAAYWLLFRDLILSRKSRAGSLRHPLLLAGVAVALVIPFLFRGWEVGGGLGTAFIFAFTSIIVGLREELLYRAVLLNLLEPKMGREGAIGLSTIIFVVYHYGALPIESLPIIQTVCMSLLLGLIYTRSGSLFFVVALHSLYDGIWFFGPYLAAPLPDIWRPAFLLAALALVSLWAWRFDRGVPHQL